MLLMFSIVWNNDLWHISVVNNELWKCSDISSVALFLSLRKASEDQIQASHIVDVASHCGLQKEAGRYGLKVLSLYFVVPLWQQ